MPQLEQVEFFISQLFWLGVFFVILFLVLTYFTLPKIRAFLNKRDEFVQSHISKQDELIKKAEQLIENYEQKLNEAKNQASKIIAEAKESALQEKRVALVPNSIGLLVSNGHRVVVEKGAGVAANFSDKDYSEAGAEIAYKTEDVFKADIIIKVAPLTLEELSLIHI